MANYLCRAVSALIVSNSTDQREEDERMHKSAVHPDRNYSASIVIGLIEALRERGISSHQTLHGTSLTPEDLLRSAKISTADFLRVHLNAINLVPEKGFGFDVGTRYHLSSYGMYGFAVLTCSSFRQALQLIFEYSRAVEPSARQTLTEDVHGNVVTIAMDPMLGVDETPELYQFFVDRFMGQMLSAFRDVLGSDFSPTEIGVTYRKHKDSPALFKGIEDCRIMFEASENYFSFNSVWLDATVKKGNPVANADILEHCNGMLQEFDREFQYSAKVRKILLERLGQRFEFEDVCKSLAVSPRTLRRKLEQEHTSYWEIADEVRMRMALKYLRGSALEVGTISEHLGFSDPAAFRRALRRWTGQTPTQIKSQE